jgi:release factor glutamine methyltransferase
VKIPTNKIADIIEYFKNQLADIYLKEEIQAFINICFHHFIDISPAQLLIKKNERVSESELLKLNFAVKDLKKHRPIQYIIGETEFYGLKFKVTPAVLIPRPETEELVDWIIKEYKTQGDLKVIDVCTGSGCIAVSLKKELSKAEVTAVDISKEAIAVAKENAALNATNIDFIEADVLKAFPAFNNKFDIIVSNPPYVTQEDKKLMQKNVLDYEPHLALFVEEDNELIFYKSIADFAKGALSENGSLYFEINESKGDELKELLQENGFKNIDLKSDLSGKHRMLKCTL